MADDAIQLDLIDDILKGNFNSAEKVLHQTLAQKQNDVLDQEKIKMASQVFNGAQPEDDEEVELSDEEIDAAIDSVRDKDSVITLMFEVPGVDGTTFEAGRIDLTGAEEAMRERVLNKLIAAKNKKLSDTGDEQVARFVSYLPISNIGEADFDTIETVESLLENA